MIEEKFAVDIAYQEYYRKNQCCMRCGSKTQSARVVQLSNNDSTHIWKYTCKDCKSSWRCVEHLVKYLEDE